MPVFESLIDRHANASVDERGAIEDAIFPKLIDHRNAVKRGKVGDQDKVRVTAKIKAYTGRVRSRQRSVDPILSTAR